MATYQIVPYLISVKPRSQQGGQTRPLDDLDAEHTRLVDLIAQTLIASQELGPLSFPKRSDTTFRMADVAKGSSTIYFTVTQGVKGVESRLNDAGSIVFEREPHHVEDIDFRNLLIFPEGGKYAVLLTERIGNKGVATFLRKLVVDSMRANFHEVTTEVKALTTFADLQGADIRLRSLEIRFPKRHDPHGHLLDLSAADGRFSLLWKFRAPKKLSSYTDESGERLDPSKVFGIIDPGLDAGGFNVTGERLKELGLSAELNVELPSGNKRSFTLGADEGPGLAYTLEPSPPADGASSDQSIADQYKPSDEDFLRVSREVVSDVAGSFGVSETSSTYCKIPAPADEVVVPEDWKAVWNVPAHLVPDSA